MTNKWIGEDGKVVKRTSDRKKGESRRQRVDRHVQELAQERGISPAQARKILQTGNPKVPAPTISE